MNAIQTPCASAEGLRWTLSAALVRGSFTAIAIASQQAAEEAPFGHDHGSSFTLRPHRPSPWRPLASFLILPDNHRDFWSSLVRHSVRTWGFAARLNDITSFYTEVRPIRALSASFSSLRLYFFFPLINKLCYSCLLLICKRGVCAPYLQNSDTLQFYLGFWLYNVWPIEVYTENFLFLRVEEVRRGLVSAILSMRSGSGEVIKKMSGWVVGACKISRS
jgi:hypothetical protein